MIHVTNQFAVEMFGLGEYELTPSHCCISLSEREITKILTISEMIMNTPDVVSVEMAISAKFGGDDESILNCFDAVSHNIDQNILLTESPSLKIYSTHFYVTCIPKHCDDLYLKTSSSVPLSKLSPESSVSLYIA